MTLDENSRKELIQYNIEKVNKSIEDIQFLIDNDKLELAINRIYYGLFYILNALALKNKYQTSKHQQLIGWFNKTYIKEGKVDKEYGKILHTAYDNRSEADYGAFVEFEKDPVLQQFEDMKKFVNEVLKLINI